MKRPWRRKAPKPLLKLGSLGQGCNDPEAKKPKPLMSKTKVALLCTPAKGGADSERGVSTCVRRSCNAGKTIRERRAPPLFKSYQMFRWSSWTLNGAPLIPLERVIIDLEKQIVDPGGSLGDLEIPLGEP